MPPVLVQMMQLQSEIKVAFMRMGAGQDEAGEMASGAMHLFLTSDLVKDEAKQLYQEQSSKGGNA